MDIDDWERAKHWCLVTTKLQTDRGSEFVNETLRKFLKSRRVELFSSRGSGKAYLAESKIGQMKRQLVRIQDILERDIKKKKKKRKRKRASSSNSKKKKTKKRQQYDSEGEEIDEEDRFDDFTVYASDWTKYLKELQTKINSKRNTRTGYTPAQLFKRFRPTGTASNRQDWEKRYRVNETKTLFEPLEDTLVKMRLLQRGGASSRQHKRLLARVKVRTRRENKQHAWKSHLRVGDRVFLTHSRLKGYPSEKPLRIFEKRSTQTQSEWATTRPYRIVDIKNSSKMDDAPKRYRIRNEKSGLLRKTMYYREELLSPPSSTKKAKKKKRV